MSKSSTNNLYELEPIDELCERSRKLLCDYGKRSKDHYGNNLTIFGLADWTIYSREGLLWLHRKNDTDTINVFSVDEIGNLESIDALECAFALDKFREHGILEDLSRI
jgi:hypothetical protein